MKRVLIAEDDPYMLDYYKDLFRDLGCVDEVNNASDLVKKVSFGGHYGLIVTDVQMPPGKTGLDVLPYIRSLRPQIPIVVASGDHLFADEVKKLGATSFLKKGSLYFSRELIAFGERYLK